MTRLWAIAAGQLVLALGAIWLVRSGRPVLMRLAALAALSCLLPLMLLGVVWPSIHTVVALAAAPSVLIWLACIAWPGVLRSRATRSYALGCLVLALSASALQAWWMAGCQQLTIVVPDGFSGEVRLIEDYSKGIDLAANGYVAIVPPTGENRIRDATFMHRCFTTVIRSRSGTTRGFQDEGVVAGGPRAMPSGQEWSAELDGTTYRWVVD